jgi:hypothetical protein
MLSAINASQYAFGVNYEVPMEEQHTQVSRERYNY